jgi:hypothetical protein
MEKLVQWYRSEIMIREEIIINNRKFIKTTPSENHELVKVGTDEHYGEAIDLPTSNFEYYEVELPPMEEETDDQQNEEITD